MHIASSGWSPTIDPDAPISSVFSAGTVMGILAMVNLLYSGVCERFPRIKVVWSEGGIGWVPNVLERCDRQVRRQQHWAGKQALPSELFARNMWSCMVEEPIGLKLWDLIGADRILSETDYPHSDTPFPHTQQAYAEVFDGIPDEVIRKVSYENACSLFNWTMADDALATPDVPWEAPTNYQPRWSGALKSRRTPDIGYGESPRPGTCRVSVLRGALYENCGQDLLADGACRGGHRASS
jgi:hypothetical protein